MRALPLLLALLLASACADAPAEQGASGDLAARPLRVVATTSIVADLAREIGGERAAVDALMGPGVDPHLYRASEGDVARMAGADLVLLGGLGLEGRMGDVLGGLERRGVRVAAVAEGVPGARRLAAEGYEGAADPHVWMDVALWREAARAAAEAFAALDPAHADAYRARRAAYDARLAALDAWARERLQTVPPEHRVLVTSHDAFRYFGRAYGLDVRGLQGISTATEAGTADVQALAAFVAARRLPAIFVETSVSPRAVEAVRAAVQARGHAVRMGGELYSDALGDAASGADTYEGMIRHNVDTVAQALGGAPDA